ncbi:hypothetical protein [Caminibacter sp.]
MLSDLINEFKDVINPKDVFNYFEFDIAKEEIISSKSNIIFLLGDPGSGKSFMFSYIKYNYPKKYSLISTPYKKITSSDLAYKKILIDEAQLLSKEKLEYFRILSDRGYQIIFAMHKEEGEKIAAFPQFNSRYIHKIYMPNLSFSEFEKFVMSKFIKHNRYELVNKKNLKKIYKYTKGNFRLSKKFIFTALSLLNFSFEHSLKYKKIDSCIIEMSAIELGF